MSAAARVMWQVALADFRERVRRYGFLAAMGGAVYFGYLIDAGYVTLSIDNRRGLMTSAWAGALTALSLGAILPLLGFYLIKNALERDRLTGVGEILAATPLSRLAYMAGKAVSGFAVLAALAAVPVAAALLLQISTGEERRLEIGALIAPVVWLTLPALALVAALAVLFETLRPLRGAFGNVVFFFTWSALLVVPAESGVRVADVIGLTFVRESFYRALGRAVPVGMSGGGFALQIGPNPAPAASSFRWVGLSWTPLLGLRILVVLGAAAAVVGLAALCFDRFDPARLPWRERGAGGRTAQLAGEAAATAAGARGPRAARRRRRLRLPHWFAGTSFGGLVAGELRLMVEGRNPWWTLVAVGLFVAGCVAPPQVVRDGILPAAWLWPLALWSGMGGREARHGTGPLVFCGPWPVAVHALAIWCAGVVVTAAAALGPGVRLLAAGDGAGVLAWLAACAFIPSLALALGSWSGGSRLFELAYLLLWYVGPLNHVPTLDYMGTTGAARAAAGGWVWLGLAAALLGAAVVGRRRLATT